jgi:hypothetical protein
VNTASEEEAGRSSTIEPPHCVSDLGARAGQVEGGGMRLNGCARPSALEPGPTSRPGANGDGAVKVKVKVALRAGR